MSSGGSHENKSAKPNHILRGFFHSLVTVFNVGGTIKYIRLVTGTHLKDNHMHKKEVGRDMLASDMNKSSVEVTAPEPCFCVKI